MNMLNTVDFQPQFSGSQNPELYDWMLDVKKHAKLMRTYSTVSAEQTELMEQQRLLAAADGETVGRDVTSLISTQLQRLDERVSKIKKEMVEIEGRAMTFVPTDSHDAQNMLMFIASVLAFGHKVDPEYLADVLAACAEVIDAWETMLSPAEFNFHS